MKTKDRILLNSLTLFNEEGEPNVTTVDIAAEMDISPGNLYYHFKGKEAIIESLYLTMEDELLEILAAPETESIEVENIWFYLYVIFEAIYKYRFFYRNIADILMRYPGVNKRFKRLVARKKSTAISSLELLQENAIANFDDYALSSLAENFALTLTYWMNFSEVNGSSEDNPVLIIHKGVFQIMSLVAPYLADDYKDLYAECRILFDAISAELENS